MIMSGTRDAQIEALQKIDIHGTLMYDVQYRHDGESQSRRARLGAESLPANLRPGNRVRVHYLMNVATAIELHSAG
ncbi:MAG: hypothetical protein HC822_18840 [Oscillochloris sp.]|nr:hypothetical protein [Oscillochloris sp.]